MGKVMEGEKLVPAQPIATGLERVDGFWRKKAHYDIVINVSTN